jgi:hypothetical protein
MSGPPCVHRPGELPGPAGFLPAGLRPLGEPAGGGTTTGVAMKVSLFACFRSMGNVLNSHLSGQERINRLSIHFTPNVNIYKFVTIFTKHEIGGSAPKFSGELTIKGLTKASTHSFSLTCPAQGSPVPAYRSVTNIGLLS